MTTTALILGTLAAAALRAVWHWWLIEKEHTRPNHKAFFWGTATVATAAAFYYSYPTIEAYDAWRYVLDATLVTMAIGLFFSFWFRFALNLMRGKGWDYLPHSRQGDPGASVYDDILTDVAELLPLPVMGVFLIVEIVLPFAAWIYLVS